MRRGLFSILLLLLAASGLRAQTDSLLREGDRLHRQYRFEEAMELYAAASAGAQGDTLELIRARARQCQNALNMTDFCTDPVVVARQRFPRRDFFLFYPLKNQSWRLSPNSLDPSEDAFPTYAPKGGRMVCFSAPDPSGARNLYLTWDRDTLWSAPELMGEQLLSLGNEVFPMLSEDGNTLTFASDGFYGMGGYDLYTSTRDPETGTWSEPVNMGFPYSSPGDDFLLVDSPDGRYTLFASNRDCSRDSVYIYVVEKQASATRVPVRDPAALSRMASLIPLNDPTRLDHGSAVSATAPESDETRLYRQKMAEARVLKDSIYACERGLDSLRLRLSAEGGDRMAISEILQEKEALLTPLRTRLAETNRTIRHIEQSFLRSGVVSDSDRADREVVGARSGYTFSKNAVGARLRMKLASPERAGEPTYKVAPVGRFAQSTDLPFGVVYQIQLFTSARHATLDEIKGLSPVYERLTSSLRYTYAVGQFRSYSEALAQLNPIRHLGFPEALIVAFIDGRPVPVPEARRLE